MGQKCHNKRGAERPAGDDQRMGSDAFGDAEVEEEVVDFLGAGFHEG